MRYLTLATAAFLAFANTGVAETYVLDQGHTEVRFSWNHMGLTTQNAEWTIVTGTIDFDPTDVPATKVNIEIDPASLHTGFEELDDMLSSESFFDVEKYPNISFKSTSAVQTGADTMRMTGDLTVKGQTTEVELDVTLTFMGKHPAAEYFDYYKGDWVAVEAKGTLLRSELGVGFAAPAVSDIVNLEISAEMRAGGWPD